VGRVHHFDVNVSHCRLEIHATSEVDTLEEDPHSGVNWVGDDWDELRDRKLSAGYAEFLAPSPYVPFDSRAVEIGAAIHEPGISVAEFLVRLSRHLHKTLDYDPDVTHVHTVLHDVLEHRAGVCQDFAHVMLACCRCQGIPARYVSGYLYTDGSLHLRGSQATHAWVECLVPGGKWLGLDPTNSMVVNDRYIKVHAGVDYSDVSPTRGIYFGPAASSLQVGVHVQSLPAAMGSQRIASVEQ
jgi:transglutaminase-like putative cysteine protease